MVAPEGLVGYVTDTTDSTADVRLITDPACRISCMLEAAPGSEPSRGILQGRGWKSGNADVADFLYVADPLRIDYLRRDDAAGRDGPVANDASGAGAGVPARTRVMTSGLSGTIPGGIPVGWLVSAAVDPDGLYRAVPRFSLYRWHLPDPIRFRDGIRVTVQDLGWRSGGRYLSRRDDISTVAYWYQSEPFTDFPPFPSPDALEIV